MAAAGFDDLTLALSAALAAMPEGADLEEVLSQLGVAYVMFALNRPAEFRIMFGNECDEADAERVLAAQKLHALLENVLAGEVPPDQVPDASLALWGMAHGLAFLHLDGKLRPNPVEEVQARVRAAVSGVLHLQASAQA